MLFLILLSLLVGMRFSQSEEIGTTPVPSSDSQDRFVDLSYLYDNQTVYYPGQREFVLTKISDNEFYIANSFCTAEHGGTHLDAPFHFYREGGMTIDQIPLNRLADVPASLVDVEKFVNKLEKPSEFVLEVEHLEEHEKLNGRIPQDGILLLHTGWSKYWPDKIKYSGWDNSTESKSEVNYPGISEESANWLLEQRGIVAVGIDTLSIDPGNRKNFPAHVYLSRKQVYNIENLANLPELINKIAAAGSSEECNLHLFVLPLRISHGTGSPARVLGYCKGTL